jgi:hypothetical protein
MNVYNITCLSYLPSQTRPKACPPPENKFQARSTVRTQRYHPTVHPSHSRSVLGPISTQRSKRTRRRRPREPCGGGGGGDGSHHRQQVKSRPQDRERLLRGDLPRFGLALSIDFCSSRVVLSLLVWIWRGFWLCCALYAAAHVDTYEIVAVKIVSSSSSSVLPLPCHCSVRVCVLRLLCHWLLEVLGFGWNLDCHVMLSGGSTLIVM